MEDFLSVTKEVGQRGPHGGMTGGKAGQSRLIRNYTIPQGWAISAVRKPSNHHRVCAIRLGRCQTEGRESPIWGNLHNRRPLLSNHLMLFMP